MFAKQKHYTYFKKNLLTDNRNHDASCFLLTQLFEYKNPLPTKKHNPKRVNEYAYCESDCNRKLKSELPNANAFQIMAQPHAQNETYFHMYLCTAGFKNLCIKFTNIYRWGDFNPAPRRPRPPAVRPPSVEQLPLQTILLYGCNQSTGHVNESAGAARH